MMAKKICDELGYNLQIVRLDWDSLIPAVSTGQVDCVIAGQSITTERLQAVDFTEPYYYATIVTLVKNGSKYADAKSAAVSMKSEIQKRSALLLSAVVLS